MKELCFRVESETGTGMYCHQLGSGIIRQLSSELGDDNFSPDAWHPEPIDDRLLGPVWADMGFGESQNYFFGFSSLEQLRRWLYNQETLAELKAAGMRIAIYQTEDNHIGDTQMIFRKSTATLCGYADLI